MHNIVLAIVICGISIAFAIGPFLWPKSEEEQKLEEFHTSTPIDLVDPEMAPPEIKPLVMQGFNILRECKKNLPEYAKDGVNCTNCHFAAGNTLGGTNNGISLVGATKHYPFKPPGEDGLITIEDRINGCFLKSMNGKALPAKSQEMRAIVAYLTWISSPVKNIPITWRGLPPLYSNHTPNRQKGAQLFAAHCAECHGKNGEGQERSEALSYPTLWGPHSFNAPDGMNKFPTLTSFIYFNMPYKDPFLTLDEALDIAAFLVSEPKPYLPSGQQDRGKHDNQDR